MEIGIERGLILLARKPPRLMHGDRQADFFLVAPPLTVTEAEVDEILLLIRQCLEDFGREVGDITAD